MMGRKYILLSRSLGGGADVIRIENAYKKGKTLLEAGAAFSEFGTGGAGAYQRGPGNAGPHRASKENLGSWKA